VLEVVCEPARKIRDLLRGHPRVGRIQLFGDRLHVLPADPEDNLSDLLSRPEVKQVRWVEASLEDVFIQRVSAAAEAVHA
jgi:hypothetical protein